ncbi:VOC family protein [candidate division WS5 bacterium]|uniref:VOC family protein n=1 Tax=candidate division WS5 bacterium TaxID=2093353 RepID=A0A419DED9_9BACT|nr:MAG: VOC family protein [candidate division WS5 bacterium]
MPRVVHFEFGADDTKRAVKFYKEVFGWKFDEYPGPVEYWLATTGDEKEAGINGAIAPRQEGWNVSNAIDVPDVDEYINIIKEKGGEVLTEKMAIPGVGYMAYFKDTEGNVLSIYQDDPNAK